MWSTNTWQEEIFSSINGAGIIEYSQGKEWNWAHNLHQSQKLTQNGLKALM